QASDRRDGRGDRHGGVRGGAVGPAAADGAGPNLRRRHPAGGGGGAGIPGGAVLMLATLVVPRQFPQPDNSGFPWLTVVTFLPLATAMIRSFLALDLLLFFLFFEALLFPMYLIIGGWGSERRVYAAVKFFLFTMAGSAFLLVSILFLYFQAGSQLGHPTFDF